jgi:NitT/TauT family transport system substrate-binding protein
MKTALSRTTFLGLSAAATLAPSLAGAQSLPKVRVSSALDEDILGTVWGQQSGIFTKHGLDVSLQGNNSGAAVAAAVIGNSVDIGKSSLIGLLAAHVKGLPLVLVAAAGIYYKKIHTVNLIVKKGSPIKTARELNGKTLSVQALNDQFAIAVEAWMDQNGGDSTTLKFLELPNAAAAQAVIAGRVDGAAYTTPLVTEALAGGGVQTLAYPFDAIGDGFVQAAYFCTSDYATKNREVVEKFAGAVFEAASYVDAHPAQTMAALTQFTKVPPEVLAQMPRTRLAAKLDPHRIQPVIDIAYKYKAISTAFDAKDMIPPYILHA